jgi:galactokinase
MSDLIKFVKQSFKEIVGKPAEITVQAPGRVNLIGEHTDYNDGFVLPCAINFQTIVCASQRSDDVVRVTSLDYENEVDEFSLSEDITHSAKSWANYIRGVIKHLKIRGYKFSGADMAISGNIPQGAGLSSSASLEVAIGQTFKALYSLDISQQEIALNGQAAENRFVGCNCGNMDQLISAQAKKNHALLIDCRNLATIPVSLPQNLSVVIVNSNKRRGLVDSEYNNRRAQCETAASYFAVNALRDVSLEYFNENKSNLDPIIAKRAKHVITENERTLSATKALAKNDISTLQRLMAESHESMRDDFEVTVPEIDALVDIIKAEVGEYGGVRMTGGGFGGCVVALVPNDLVENVVAAINEKYPAISGLTSSIYVCTAEYGAGEVAAV